MSLKRLYLPTVVAVKDGNIIGYKENVEDIMDESFDTTKQANLKEEYISMMKKLME